ncbi:MAG TPA: DUF177 domain-containing protein [Vicinamibacterales bacterium]|nr:DUF177 domain-containing protein [Vicinamibacterales bacterium]
MQLDLKSIRQPETSFDQTYPPESFPPEDDYRVVEPVHLAMVIHKDDARVRLVGTVSTRLELSCSRCLEPIQVPVQAPFGLRYLPQALAGIREEDPDDDPATTFYSDDQLDLGQMVREQCYLAIPMKPLCRPDCQGLCSTCGTNLNTERCQCNPQWLDPRLAALQALITPRTNDDA